MCDRIAVNVMCDRIAVNRRWILLRSGGGDYYLLLELRAWRRFYRHEGTGCAPDRNSRNALTKAVRVSANRKSCLCEIKARCGPEGPPRQRHSSPAAGGKKEDAGRKARHYKRTG